MILQRQTERYVKLFGDQSFWLTSVQHHFSTLTTIQIIIPDPTPAYLFQLLRCLSGFFEGLEFLTSTQAIFVVKKVGSQKGSRQQNFQKEMDSKNK